MKKLLLYIFIISFSINLKAQKEDKYPNIEFINSKFSFSTYYVNNYSYLKLSSRLSDDSPPVYYMPNLRGGIGAKIKIKGFSFAYTFKLPQDNYYGNTDYFDLNFNFQKRVFGLSLYYTSYKGLYIKNPEEINYIYPKKNYPVRSDIKLTSFGFSTQFSFMKSFSINAAFEQTERQKKTAGSFIIMFSDRFSTLKSDSSIVPYSVINDYDRLPNINKLNINTFKIAPGAGYTFVLSKYFSITTMLYTGWGFQMKFYKLSGKQKFGVRLPFYVNSKNAIGYNGEDVFCRLVYNLELNDIKFTDSKITLFSTFLQFTLGFRLK